jgi:hypothetical protein
MLLARLVLYTTLGYLLDGLGHQWNTWPFWSVLGLFWASEHIARIETIARVEEEIRALRRRLQGQKNEQQPD